LRAEFEAEASILLAFMDVMDENRIAGDLLGWRITRDQKGCVLELMTIEGHHFEARDHTFDEARKRLSAEMISVALEGMPKA
jgi:hypothetical protein